MHTLWRLYNTPGPELVTKRFLKTLSDIKPKFLIFHRKLLILSSVLRTYFRIGVTIGSYSAASMLKKLASNKDVVVCKPDKGNIIVLIDSPKYVHSMTAVISDGIKFEPIVTPIGKYVRKTEDVFQYIGSTMRTLHTRVAEHAGRSFRTEALLTSPHSNIRAHALSCSSPVAIDNFNILARWNNNIDVRILEYLFIYKIRPDLNDSQSAFPVNIVYR